MEEYRTFYNKSKLSPDSFLSILIAITNFTCLFIC